MATALPSPPHAHPGSPHPLADHLATRLGALPPAIDRWARSARRLECGRGQALLRAGDPWRHLWWVEHGLLRLFYLDTAGAEWNKNFFLDSDLFWPVSAGMRDAPVMFHVEPCAASVVWSLPYDSDAPCHSWDTWARLETRTLGALLDAKMLREQEFLQSSAGERYAALCARRPDWVARIPQRQLASYLGITEVSLSRLRASRGLIKG